MSVNESNFLEDERRFKLKNPAMTRMIKDYQRETTAERARRNLFETERMKREYKKGVPDAC